MDIRVHRKILRMVAELHVRGYQWLRIVPHIASVGAWRCGVTPVSNILAEHGALPDSWDWDILPQYSSASGRQYFDWDDAAHATPSRLADLFLQRFPRIARQGYGSDWVYAGWFIEMLHLTYPESLPIAQGDYYSIPPDRLGAIGHEPLRPIPMPPPGWVRRGLNL